MIFVKRDGDDILFCTIKGRRKTINMRRDPRVNLLIHGLPVDRPNHAGDGPNYANILAPEHSPKTQAGRFIRRSTTSTWAARPPPPEPGAQWVIVRIVPQRIYVPTFPGPSNGDRSTR
ncbi:MAG: hypothetical protein ACLP0J_09045 [Solirubrobacteraceae bacterium]